MTTNPPVFLHAETVGSLLHPEPLMQARRGHDAGGIDDAALHAIEDEAVRQAVALQERVGLEIVTDGELRRNTYIDFVLTGLTGVSLEWRADDTIAATYKDTSGAPAATPKPVLAVSERIRHSPSSAGPSDFRFLRDTTTKLGKATMVGPAIIHFFGGRAAIDAGVYPNLDVFWADLITAFGIELDQLREAGCTYVQFDETSLIKLADLGIRSWITARGDDPDRLVDLYIDVLEAIFSAAPADMRIALHLCRGNNKGTWQAQGGYDAIAEKMFRRLSVDVYSLEYDSPRAGSFEPLSRLPADKMVILGLLSTKTPMLEDLDQMVARINEASRFVPLDRLGVSPQCGFWGGINLCTPAEAEAKLRRVVEIAERVWTRAG